MPKRSDEYMQERRDHILKAAEFCLIEYGYSKMSVADICKAADISMGALYKHFKCKKDILLALIESSLTEQKDIKITSLSELRGLISERIACLDQQDGEKVAKANFELLYISLNDDELRRYSTRNFLEWEKVITRALGGMQKSGNITSDCDADLISKQLSAAMNGLWLMKAIMPDVQGKSYLPAIIALLDGIDA
ncbi:TetR/AcrR family transcriptional regulator [Kordiimonas pumila]|uniref:TetR/AcrR family transcriptional regulator n=1 Tax=Kordiimonas pumila TaxID=2161677 RepID=A0ABV7D0K4_9PROT|nr:TetR/AcrR family transcriptional regulator [Kordiimonas pumila]